MALSANSVFEVQTGGADTNGGGFVTGAAGTDYSLVAGKRVATGADDSTTDAVAVGTGAITSATAVFGTTIVGNIIYLQGGTGALAAGWYQVTSRTNTTTIGVDRNVAAGTGITMNIGGALASPGMACGTGLVASNIVYVKAGTYSITSASTNIAGGCCAPATQVVFEGYNASRGDLGTPPLFQASGISTFTIFTVGNSGGVAALYNIRVDGAGLTSSRGFNFPTGIGYKLTAENCTNNGFNTVGAVLTRCAATGCATQPAYSCTQTIYVNCVAYSNTISGFVTTVNATYTRCLAYSNSGASSDGFALDLGASAVNCVSYGNGRDGFRMTDDQVILNNCIGEANTGFGFQSSFTSILLLNCATFNNTGGSTSLLTDVSNRTIGLVTGSGSFFTNAAGADFSLNNTAGAGAAARAAGYPGALPIGGTGFVDIGVLQHADPASSGSGGYGAAIFGG